MMLTRIAFISLIVSSAAFACLRATPDKRAIQWSDVIVHAKLVTIVDPAKEIYSFNVTDSIDGSLKPGQELRVQHITPAGGDQSCGGHLTVDDTGKNFLLLLRSANNHDYVVVNITSADKSDALGADAFKELVEETRKAEASLTDDQMKVQAEAYANAQDDTEADQAEEALRQMGPKAVPMIEQVMKDAGDIGKHRLATVAKDLAPPLEDAAATQPSK
jgi:hypothetical protein